jgi:hypothetical protein
MRSERLVGRLSRDDGFAIPAAIFVIVVVSLLALSGIYVAQSNATANAGIQSSWRALYAADAGAAEVIATWERSDYVTLMPGDSVDTGWRTLLDGSQYRSTILRVDDDLTGRETLFRLRTVGRPGAGMTARRELVNMVRVVRADVLCCDAAIKLQGGLRIQGTGAGVKVSGLDVEPGEWAGRCPPDASDIPGVLMQDTDRLLISGQPVLEGDPPVQEDPFIEEDDFLEFGEITYDDLARIADKHLAGSQVWPDILPEVGDGVCLESLDTNWGDPEDPSSPCWDYLPIVHVSGDLKISGNAFGQGILLVDGDLEVTGSFEYYGIAIVQGQADFKGTADVNGALLVRNGVEAADQTWLRGGTTLQYSSCAATRAISQALVARPLAGRSWFEVLD